MSLTSAVQIFDVVAPRGARALPNTVPARICVTSNVRNFASFWPRSSGTGEARSYVFQCADLIELQCDTVVPARKAEPLFVAILNRNDEPLVLLPFCIERRQDPSRPVMSVRVLKFLDGGLSDYNTPVVFPVAADWDAKTVRRIWRGLQKALPAFDIAVLEKVPEYVGDLPNPLRPLVNTPEPRSGHAVNLSRKTLAKRLINDKRLQRKLRILGQTGRLTFEIAKTPEQYDTFVEALFRQKNRRDIELRSQESLRGPGYRAYFRKARRYLYPKGPVCLFALKLNDAILATQFAQTFGLRLISQISGFEGGEWSKYSPGHILKREIVQWCLSEGVNILDFGCGDEK